MKPKSGSLFNFGRGSNLMRQSLQNVEPNSSGDPYALNLKDSSLFQIPEIYDLGTNNHSLMHENQMLNISHIATHPKI